MLILKHKQTGKCLRLNDSTPPPYLVKNAPKNSSKILIDGNVYEATCMINSDDTRCFHLKYNDSYYKIVKVANNSYIDKSVNAKDLLIDNSEFEVDSVKTLKKATEKIHKTSKKVEVDCSDESTPTEVKTTKLSQNTHSVVYYTCLQPEFPYVDSVHSSLESATNRMKKLSEMSKDKLAKLLDIKKAKELETIKFDIKSYYACEKSNLKNTEMTDENCE